MTEHAAHPRIYLYDTTLRDGAQTRGVDFSPADKAALAKALDTFGLDYIEGGWPGANPTDDRFFAEPPSLKHSRLTAFGMTRRAGRSAANDPGLSAVLNSGAGAFCLVGKTWDFHVDVALGISRDENLDTIRDSVALAASKGEALFDAEHFFDGYKANPDYALSCLKAAHEGGARWIVLCDTNGGTLPHEVADIVAAAAQVVPAEHLGIHAHDDTGNAVANSLAAIRAGARMIQGTLNGLGERCGNANLVSLIPTLVFKMGYDVGIPDETIRNLRSLSRFLDELINVPASTHAPYVGDRAFAHKGGLHVSALRKDSSSYEHIDPALVGNDRFIIVSDQAGRSNILERLKDLGITVSPDDPAINRLVDLVKQREAEGYAYDGADASFAVLTRRMLGQVPAFFHVERYAAQVERRYNARGEQGTESEASVKVRVGSTTLHTVAEGNGPVNALDNALRKALVSVWPEIAGIVLKDYRVRILKPQDATAAMPRVLIESAHRDAPQDSWFTIGVSTNIIEASFEALEDSYTHFLLSRGARAMA